MKARDWDRLAGDYGDQALDIFERDRKNVAGQWMQSMSLLRAGKSIVDVGCGVGSFFRRFGRYFGEKTGVDQSPKMLRIAAKRCRNIPGCRWQRADVRQLPRGLRDRYDVVVCSNVITFVSAAECHRAMRAVLRFAHAGGWLLIVLPALESHDTVTTFVTGRRPRRRSTTTAIVRRSDRLQRFFSAEGALQLARQSGVRAVQLRKVWYPWIDEGISPPPNCGEPPWCWLLTGRR